MPRKAKELVEKIEKVATSPAKKATSKKAVTEKKVTTKKAGTSSKAKSTETKKKTTTSAKTKTNTTKKGTVTTKKKATAKATSTTRKKKASPVQEPISMLEYYDLPYRYSQTVVKILAQTPKMLFVYWDISEEDRQNYILQYGEDFFNNTVPFLRVKNENNNYTFEIDVDDFANSWYLPISDAKCTYTIELLRKQKPQTAPVIQNEIYITSSNKLEAPNDHILFEKQQKMVYFKNVKTNQVSSKNVATLTFMKNMGKIYNIYDLYQQIYHNEELDVLSNPSSNPSSDFITNNLN